MRRARYTGRHTRRRPDTTDHTTRDSQIVCGLFMLAVVAIAALDWVAVDIWLMQ